MRKFNLEWWQYASESLSLAARTESPPEAPLQILQEGLSVDAALLVVDGESLTEPGHIVASVGYSDAVAELMRDWYPRRCPGYQYAKEKKVAVRICDTPFDFRNTRTYAEALGPSGFREGVTVTFGTPGSGRSGFLAMSSHSPEPLGDDARLGLTILSSELARLASPPAITSGKTNKSEEILEINGAGEIYWLQRQHEGISAISEASLRTFAQYLRNAATSHSAYYAQDTNRTWWHVRGEKMTDHEPLRIRISITKQKPMAALTARELDVLGLVYRGLTNRQIASQLHISLRTVKSHVETLLQKLEQQNRTGLAAIASTNDLFNPYTLFNTAST